MVDVFFHAIVFNLEWKASKFEEDTVVMRCGSGFVMVLEIGHLLFVL